MQNTETFCKIEMHISVSHCYGYKIVFSDVVNYTADLCKIESNCE